SPLHESQVEEDRLAGRTTLVVVTQAPNQQACLVTAVDDEDGKILWQRQLGLVCQSAPLALTPPAGGTPVLLAVEGSGGLSVLDPLRLPPIPGAQWQSDDQTAVNNGGPLENIGDVPPLLLPGPGGRSAYAVAALDGGSRLLIRHVGFGEGGRRPEV